MALPFFLMALVLFLAYANGANDNFKGVATLFGSGAASYRVALAWGTGATLAGSLTAIYVARGLIDAFSGKGLVLDELAAAPVFAAAVAFGAGATVLLASRLAFPVSTTHALIGALAGVGLVMAGNDLRLAALGGKFALPLLLSPLLAVVLTALLYPVMRWSRRRLGVERETCVCVGKKWVPATALASGEATAAGGLQIGVCEERYQGTVLAVEAHQVLHVAHFLSAGAVSFARGLNDTPKIVALLVAAEIFAVDRALLFVGLAMAVGGVLQARRVADTMGRRITEMNHGQAFTANLVTAALVIVASRFGLPVSTTHVSCGALFGLGGVTGQLRPGVLGKIVLAWVVTLPVAAASAAAAAVVLR